MLRGVPDKVGSGTNTPNERVPPARLDFQNNWTARVIRKNRNPAYLSIWVRLAG